MASLLDLQRFILARADMAQAREAAVCLQGNINSDLARALETAIAVCYYRPFSSNKGLRALSERWRPGDARGRTLHAELALLRKQTYAHSDLATSGREIVNVGNIVGKPRLYTESWMPLDKAVLPDLIDMFTVTHDRFETEISRIEAELSAADVAAQAPRAVHVTRLPLRRR